MRPVKPTGRGRLLAARIDVTTVAGADPGRYAHGASFGNESPSGSMQEGARPLGISIMQRRAQGLIRTLYVEGCVGNANPTARDGPTTSTSRLQEVACILAARSKVWTGAGADPGRYMHSASFQCGCYTGDASV